MSDEPEWIANFKCDIRENNLALPVAAMKALVQSIKRSKATTWMQLEQELRQAIDSLKSSSRTQRDLGGRTPISLGSGCDLFMKYVTRAFSLDTLEFDKCKEELILRGEKYAVFSMNSRARIADIGNSFIQDSCTLLIHGNSRVVAALLLKAVAEGKQFNVFITEGRPFGDDETDCYAAARQFIEAGIPTKVILDCAVGALMEQVDLCIVGAEGVMENGGIINKLGTYQLAIVAKAFKKPFYVAVESYKFARMYPLSQRDLADLLPSCPTGYTGGGVSGLSGLGLSRQNSDLSSSNLRPSALPLGVTYDESVVDFTPAEYITLLNTDLGILTPAAISDPPPHSIVPVSQ